MWFDQKIKRSVLTCKISTLNYTALVHARMCVTNLFIFDTEDVSCTRPWPACYYGNGILVTAPQGEATSALETCPSTRVPSIDECQYSELKQLGYCLNVKHLYFLRDNFDGCFLQCCVFCRVWKDSPKVNFVSSMGAKLRSNRDSNTGSPVY